MNPVVAVIAPGMMGAAVGGRLAAHGLKVLTSLTGRSAETVARAKAAGLSAASDEEIAASDFILSILPPGDAVALAQRFAPALTASNAKPVFVDCNAISPPTAERVAAVVGPTGSPFVDAGIIGSPPPPKEGKGPRFYASGAHAATFRGTQEFRPRRARAVRPADRSLGDEDVLRRNHQGHAGARRRDDAGGDTRRLRRCVVRGVEGQPAADPRLYAAFARDHAAQGLPLGRGDARDRRLRRRRPRRARALFRRRAFLRAGRPRLRRRQERGQRPAGVPQQGQANSRPLRPYCSEAARRNSACHLDGIAARGTSCPAGRRLRSAACW